MMSFNVEDLCFSVLAVAPIDLAIAGKHVTSGYECGKLCANDLLEPQPVPPVLMLQLLAAIASTPTRSHAFLAGQVFDA